MQRMQRVCSLQRHFEITRETGIDLRPVFYLSHIFTRSSQLIVTHMEGLNGRVGFQGGSKTTIWLVIEQPDL